MSRTNTVSLTRLRGVQPTACSAIARLRKTWAAWAAKSPFSDQLTGFVGGRLARDEHEAACADLDHLRVTRQWSEFRGVDDFNLMVGVG